MWSPALEFVAELAFETLATLSGLGRTPRPTDPKQPLLFRELPEVWTSVCLLIMAALILALAWLGDCL